jgi:thioesterase domain-containing protein
MRDAKNSDPAVPETMLAELQAIIEKQIPMCGHMGIRIHACDQQGLALSAPLDRNLNHQATAFAGTLNALCTVTGWGTVFLLTRMHTLPGDVVIRRSAIKFLRPVTSTTIIARCKPIDEDDRQHFVEMLAAKGQAKLDLRVEIADQNITAVAFHGSYVVLNRGT